MPVNLPFEVSTCRRFCHSKPEGMDYDDYMTYLLDEAGVATDA